MAVRTLIVVPARVAIGAVVEIRASLGHVMETGLRADSEGRLVPRDIVTRFECRLDNQPVFAADMYPAVAANPYLSFWLRVPGPGTLSFEWLGDHGFQHRETRPLNLL